MPASHKTILRFPSWHGAVQAWEILSEMPGLEAVPLILREDNGLWVLECYDDGKLAEKGAMRALEYAGVNVGSHAVETVPRTDWVTETQRSLPPVHAGRFIVHGSHDAARAFSQWAIEIDAGRAFGTAHHATTKGCLLAIAELPPSARRKTLLDLGTGSGVLAIAASKAFCHRAQAAAADVDPIAAAVARENCRRNGVTATVKVFVGDGLKPGHAYRPAPFDIVMANILAEPLLRLAPRLRGLTKRGGTLILSGLLTEQARELLARYRATGFQLIRRRDLEGWATLSLRRAT
jgi:ribosomal protein L11 methyltransferase